MYSITSALFLITILRASLYVLADTSALPSEASPTNTLVWERRINASLWLLQNKACRFFTSNGNCSDLRSRPRNAMNLYTASTGSHKLIAVSPDKIKLVPTSYEAVLVLDPYPHSSFGHPVLVFFIEFSRTLADCANNKKSTFTGKFTLKFQYFAFICKFRGRFLFSNYACLFIGSNFLGVMHIFWISVAPVGRFIGLEQLKH